MPPGDLYTLAIVLTALLVAPFSGMARIIVLSWLAGHVAWSLGYTESSVNLVQHAAASLFGIRYVRPRANLFAWSLFGPMLAVDLVRFGSESNAVAPWWMILGLAAIQIACLPFGMDWEKAKYQWGEWLHSLTKWPFWLERRVAGI